MGHQDMGDLLSWRHGLQNGLQVVFVVRARVDHRKTPCAQQVSVGSSAREGGRIGRQEAANPGIKLFDLPGLRRRALDDVHTAFLRSCPVIG